MPKSQIKPAYTCRVKKMEHPVDCGLAVDGWIALRMAWKRSCDGILSLKSRNCSNHLRFARPNSAIETKSSAPEITAHKAMVTMLAVQSSNSKYSFVSANCRNCTSRIVQLNFQTMHVRSTTRCKTKRNPRPFILVIPRSVARLCL